MATSQEATSRTTRTWYSGRAVFGWNGLWYTTIKSTYMKRRQLFAAMSKPRIMSMSEL